MLSRYCRFNALLSFMVTVCALSAHAELPPPRNLRLAGSENPPNVFEHHYTVLPDQNPALDPYRTAGILWDGSTRYQVRDTGTASYRFGILHLWPLSTANNLGDVGPIKNNAESTGAAVAYPSGGPLGSGYAQFTADTKLRAAKGSLDETSVLAQGLSFGAWIMPTGLERGYLLEQSWDAYSAQYNQQKINCVLRESSGTTLASITSGTIPLNAWTHYMCSYDPLTQQFTMFINGQQASQARVGANSGTLFTMGKIGIGNRPLDGGADPANAFRGGMTDLAIWGRGLYPDEALLLFQDRVRLAPADASFVSDRVAYPDSRIVQDVTFDLINPQGRVRAFVNVGGPAWYPIASGQTLRNVTALRDQEGFAGVRYRISFEKGDASLEGVKLTFGQPATETVSAPKLGMNIPMMSYYSAGLSFIDVVRPSQPYGLRQQAILNSYARDLSPGNYTILCEGSGTGWIDAYGYRRQAFSCPGTTTFSYQPPGTERHVWYDYIGSQDALNPIKNLRFIQPGMLDRYQTETFHPTFIDSLKSFNTLRMMDLLRTNSSQLQTWSQRATPDNYNSDRELPIEYVAEIANAAGVDPWMNVPHKADADYVRHFALLLKQKLNPGRKVYVEYSNEVWNWGFGQTTWVADWGTQNGFDHHQAAAYKSLWVTSIFKEVLGADRVVGVLPGWVDAWNQPVLEATRRADVNPWGVVPEAIAVAPYVGYEVFGFSRTRSFTIDDILDTILFDLTAYRKRLQAHKALGARYNVQVLGYEAGPHLAGQENDFFNVEKFMKANRHPRMKELMRRYYSIWAQEMGTIVNQFNQFSSFSKWGSWGMSEYLMQPLGERPKFAAIQPLADLDKARRDGATPRCGNGVVDPGEECDGQAFWKTTSACGDFHPIYTSGTLLCNASCRVDTSQCVPAVSCALKAPFFDNNDWQQKARIGDGIKLVAPAVEGGRCKGRKVKLEAFYAPRGLSRVSLGAVYTTFYDEQVAMEPWTVVLPNPVPGSTTDMPYSLEATLLDSAGHADGPTQTMAGTWKMSQQP